MSTLRNICFSVAFTLVAIVLIMIGVNLFENRPTPFDRKIWIASDERSENVNIRKRMIHDLFAKNRLVGKPRSEVIRLLGEAEKYSDPDNSADYYMIHEEWDVIDPSIIDELIVKYDPRTMLVSECVIRHHVRHGKETFSTVQ